LSTEQGLPRDGKRPKRSARAAGYLGALSILIVLVLSPFAFFAVLFWMVDGPWQFEGGGLRYWLFVKDSRLERMGFVAPTGAPAQYSIRIQEGAGPGSSFVQYTSTASPVEVLNTYAERCRDAGLKVKDLDPYLSETNPLNANLACEITMDLDIKVWTERAASATVTSVGLIVWGDE
jgi:hypothetical protein